MLSNSFSLPAYHHYSGLPNLFLFPTLSRTHSFHALTPFPRLRVRASPCPFLLLSHALTLSRSHALTPRLPVLLMALIG